MNELPSRADVVVIGLGAAGSAALSFLARAGVNVVGIDRFSPPHDMGSSHGETRMLRTAYSEGAAYVPMVKRSIALWRELEARTGTLLLRQTGVFYSGPGTSEFLKTARDTAREKSIELVEAANAPPGMAIPDAWQSLLDVAGGYLDAEASISAYLQDAKAYGATIAPNCECRAIAFREGSHVVATADGFVRAGHVVVTAGAWSSELRLWLDAFTHVERRVQHWFKDSRGRYGAARGFRPVLITTEDDAGFYGFPANRNGEVKVGEHFVAAKIPSPDTLNRAVNANDIAMIRPLASRFLPELGDYVRSSVCMYPMSRDGHFIIDWQPSEERIAFAAGLSGHGFKFAPVIGEALANLVLDQPQQIDVGFFSLKRFPEFR